MGIPKNIKEAMAWFEKAGKQKITHAVLSCSSTLMMKTNSQKIVGTNKLDQ